MKTAIVVLLLSLTSCCVTLVETVYPRQDIIFNGSTHDTIKPYLKWKADVPDSGLFLSAPVVSEGTVYACDAKGIVFAVDEHSGALKWKFKTKGILKWIRSSPSVYDGMVFASNVSGYVHAIDATTGKKRWRFKAGVRLPFVGGDFRSTPVVSDGLVICLEKSTLYALDLYTGKPKWTFSAYTMAGDYTPVVYNGMVFFGSEDTYFYAVDIKTGGLKWKFKTGSWVSYSNPAVSDGVVYFGSWDSHLYALEAQTGTLKWKFYAHDVNVDGDPGEKLTPIRSTPVIWQDKVILLAGDKYLRALNKHTGQEIWKIGAWPGQRGYTIPTVADGLVFIDDYDRAIGISVLRAFDVQTGSLNWSFEIGNTEFVDSKPTAHNGVVFFGTTGIDAGIPSFMAKTYNGHLYALEYKK